MHSGKFQVSVGHLVMFVMFACVAGSPIAVPWTQQLMNGTDGGLKLSLGFTDPAAAVYLTSIATKATLLKCSVLNFWVKYGVDGPNGFHATLGRDGTPLQPTDKSVVALSRHLWSMSNFVAARQGRPSQLVALADNLARFLLKRLVDPADGSFFSGVTRDGTKVTATGKDFYDQTVPIFALAKYSATLGSSAALKASKRAFLAWDAAVHDPVNGGYAEGRAAGNNTVSVLAAIGAPLKAKGSKSLNTQLHALLMVMDLARADPTFDVAGSRLEEMVGVLTGKMVMAATQASTTKGAASKPAGISAAGAFVSMSCAYDWATCSTGTVYNGLIAEYVWYVDSAIELLQRRGQMTPQVAAAARKTLVAVGTTALAASGFDDMYGGVFGSGVVGITSKASAQSMEKYWWVQLESTLAFYKLWQLTGDTAFLSKAEKTLGFLAGKLWDPVYGEMLFGSTREGVILKTVDCNGKVDPSKVKICGNKSSFHTGRALVQLWAWLLDAGVVDMPTCVA